MSFNWKWYQVIWNNWLWYKDDGGSRSFDDHVDLFIHGFAREDGKVVPVCVNNIILTYEGTKWKRPMFCYPKDPTPPTTDDDAD